MEDPQLAPQVGADHENGCLSGAEVLRELASAPELWPTAGLEWLVDRLATHTGADA
ncbi:MAG: hypothetical protein ACK5MY_15510 [Jhaorihella sp.]